MYRIKLRIVFHIICIYLSLSTFAQSPDELYKQSLEQMYQGNYQEALNTINKVLVLDSSKTDFLLQKATVCYHLKKFDEAVRYSYSIQKIEPDKPEVFLLRGLIGLTTKSYGGAIFFFGKAIKMAKNKDCLCKAYLNRGKVYLVTDKFTEALTDLNTAKDLSPDSVEILITLAEAYFRTKQPDDALFNVNKALTLQPGFANAYKILGDIKYEGKDYPKALEAYEKYCESNPNDAKIYQLISNMHLQNKNYEKAQISIAQASRLEPSEPLNYKVLASIYMQKGQKEEACNSIFKAFQLGYLEKYGYDLLELYLSNCEGK